LDPEKNAFHEVQSAADVHARRKAASVRMKQFKILKVAFHPDLSLEGFKYVFDQETLEIETQVNEFLSKGWEILQTDTRKDYLILFLIRDTKLRNLE
jgi:hypothetical protein